MFGTAFAETINSSLVPAKWPRTARSGARPAEHDAGHAGDCSRSLSINEDQPAGSGTRQRGRSGPTQLTDREY